MASLPGTATAIRSAEVATSAFVVLAQGEPDEPP
jgi:hypothetical protein